MSSAELVLPKAEAATTIFRCSGLVPGMRLLAHPVSNATSRLHITQRRLEFGVQKTLVFMHAVF
jgi:hypothetical protein